MIRGVHRRLRRTLQRTSRDRSEAMTQFRVARFSPARNKEEKKNIHVDLPTPPPERMSNCRRSEETSQRVAMRRLPTNNTAQSLFLHLLPGLINDYTVTPNRPLIPYVRQRIDNHRLITTR